MDFIILLIMIVIIYLTVRYIFEINIKKIEQLGKNKELDKLVSKYPENIEICKDYLKKLNNQNVKIEEDKNSNSTLYLIVSNKIFIADLKDNFTRIQTIAHECLHSIQNKKILWFNFIFSNIYLVYFFSLCILGILKFITNKWLFLSVFILFGLVYYAVRTYLEMDAMIKARFLAKEYMQEKRISTKEEIEKIISKYDELNSLGIKFTNFKFLSQILLKIVIILLIFMFL